MRRIGWRTGVALVAGLLTFTGARTLAGDPARSSAATESSTAHGPSGMGSTSASTSTSVSDATGSAQSTSHQHELTGRVESLDRTQNTITLSGKELKLDSSTEVVRDGTRATLSDVKEGDQVRASFSGSADTAAVQRLEVMTQGATGSSASGVGPGRVGGSSGSQGASGTPDRPTADPGMSTSPSSGGSTSATTGGDTTTDAKARKDAKQQDASHPSATGSGAHDVKSDAANTVGGSK